jgi:hypothetical protein
MPDIPDFRSASWKERRNDAALVASILNGKGRHMPSFSDRLSEAQAQEMVAWLRGLGKAGRRARPSSIVPTGTLPADFETRFRDLQEELKMLQRHFYELSSAFKSL